MAVTAICNSFKSELLSGGHCFNAINALTGSTNTNFNITGLASTAGIAVGMTLTGSNVAANTIVSAITSATAVVVSVATTASASNTMTFTGDTFKILLIKASPVRTFDGTQSNVGTPGVGTATAVNVGTDEVTGTGYTSGGVAATNVSPSLPGNPSTVATVTFAPNPSFTSATFTASAGIIYNTSTRLGGAATPLNGRTVGVYDFGGGQPVNAGTFTIAFPTNDGSNAAIRLA